VTRAGMAEAEPAASIGAVTRVDRRASRMISTPATVTPSLPIGDIPSTWIIDETSIVYTSSGARSGASQSWSRVRAFRYRLYPSRSQARLLTSTVETCRRLYNACLAERKAAWESERRSISKVEQLRRVKTLKATNPYAANVHSHVLQVAVADLDRAFGAFFRRVKVGETPGYPRFKGRDRFDSFGLKEYGNGWKIDGRRLKLTGIGRVAVRWHRPLEGTPKTVRVTRRADGWYASIVCDTTPQPLPATGASVGIDVGIASLVTTSDGERIPHPRWYRGSQRELRMIQRRVARRTKGGANRRRSVRLLRRQHQRIANRRRDFLNKLAHDLIRRYDLIAVEGLRIPNMVKNRHFSKSILDAAWGDFLSRLRAKAEDAARTVVVVDPAYTSQTCSRCQGRFPEHLTLAVRWVEHPCGLSMNRDENAARNILDRAGHARRSETWGTSPSVLREAAGL
jgi:putative transposase